MENVSWVQKGSGLQTKHYFIGDMCVKVPYIQMFQDVGMNIEEMQRRTMRAYNQAAENVAAFVRNGYGSMSEKAYKKEFAVAFNVQLKAFFPGSTYPSVRLTACNSHEYNGLAMTALYSEACDRY